MLSDQSIEVIIILFMVVVVWQGDIYCILHLNWAKPWNYFTVENAGIQLFSYDFINQCVGIEIACCYVRRGH